MRIDPNLAVAATSLTTPKPQTPAKPGPAGATSRSDAAASVVNLSSAGAAASAEATSPTVTSRLETIRAMLDKGEYPVDLDRLASRIVDDDFMRAGSRS